MVQQMMVPTYKEYDTVKRMLMKNRDKLMKLLTENPTEMPCDSLLAMLKGLSPKKPTNAHA